MEIINQPELLQMYLERFQIEEMFDSQDLHFRLFRYQKGEQLASPLRKTENLLFLVEGNVNIYGLRKDASLFPAAYHHPPAVYGDMEFATGCSSAFFAEAQSEVLCAALSFQQNESVLRKDVRFLNTLLRNIGGKLYLLSVLEASGSNLEEQVLYYMEHLCEDGCLRSINETIMHLHCSRRQLQRVLSKLCSSGQIVKIKKGTYRRVSDQEQGSEQIKKHEK